MTGLRPQLCGSLVVTSVQVVHGRVCKALFVLNYSLHHHRGPYNSSSIGLQLGLVMLMALHLCSTIIVSMFSSWQVSPAVRAHDVVSTAVGCTARGVKLLGAQHAGSQHDSTA